MGRMMAFIVVVVCTAQVVLLRAQERTEQPALDTSNPRFAYHKIDDGYLRLDLRSGEVATCRQHPGGWTCTLAAEERTALENEIARLQRDNALLKNALLEHGVALPSPPSADAGRPPDLKTKPQVALRHKLVAYDKPVTVLGYVEETKDGKTVRTDKTQDYSV